MDNGCIVAKGDYIAPEVYKAKTSTGFAGVIRGKAANGNYYVEVTTAGDALLLLNVPLIYEQYNTVMQQEFNFYNAKGDNVRAYELYVGDIFELSAEGFEGTPEVGKTVSVENYKLKVATE